MRHGNARLLNFVRPTIKLPPVLVAIYAWRGGTGLSYFSDNGISWSAGNGAGLDDVMINDMTYGADGFIAVGYNDSNSPLVPKAFVSKTGESWSEIPTTSLSGIVNLRTVAYSPVSKIYVIGTDNGIVTWSLKSGFVKRTSSLASVIKVNWAGDRFVAVSPSGTYRMAVSADGISWTNITSTNIAGQALYSVCRADDGIFFAGGINFIVASDTIDPTGSWTKITANLNIGSSYNDLFNSGSNRIVAGYGGTYIKYRNSGISFTQSGNIVYATRGVGAYSAFLDLAVVPTVNSVLGIATNNANGSGTWTRRNTGGSVLHVAASR